ncbi:BTAD domain-containing putative transcriptional regulator [Dactylosporangium sp. NPDC050688]|uniref:AfsR/SARP family transcriptional regulator n=1 Tax=Dactylosporangium sp. NPDC050688 TaxID=3157217 RepID=UPI0033FE320B
MEFRVLGPVQAFAAGTPVDLGDRKQRLVLAVLLLEANQLVPVGRLIRILWQDNPPPTARRIVQTHISRLRSTLTGLRETATEPRLTRCGEGYLLTCEPHRVDVHRFRSAVERARQSTEDHERVSILRQALALWRGPALADVAAEEIRDELCGGLDESRLAALEERLDAELRLGHQDRLIDDLTELSARYPHRQRLVGQLMLALHQAGRTADALRLYAGYRARLADELGLEPSAELQRLHVGILRAEPRPATAPVPPPAVPVPTPPTAAPPDRVPMPLPAPTPGSLPVSPPASLPASLPVSLPASLPASLPGSWPGSSPGALAGALPGARPPSGSAAPARPRQLPPDVSRFVGRERYLTALGNAAAPGPDSAGAAPIVLVTGMAGVGKTALVTHWAHSRAAAYPDGQLYVELRGHAKQAPLPEAEALAALLSGLGVAAAQVPPRPQEATALYRSLLAGRRMLIVLDDALGPDIVRALLPGSPTCATVITSRDRLGGLVARNGAHRIELPPLEPHEAVELATRTLGTAAPHDTAAVDRLVKLCGRLPLAIRIAATRAADRDVDLAEQVDAMAGAGLMDMLQIDGDEDAGVPAALGRSYAGLPPPAAAMFLLLGSAGPAALQADAAARLAGTTVHAAQRALHHLVNANLVNEQSTDVFRLPDLVRRYAVSRLSRPDC